MEWWNNREENEMAWRVEVKDLKKGFDLDVKNPNREKEEEIISSSEILDRLNTSLKSMQKLLSDLQEETR